MPLSLPCARVLGALVEKALTTPQQYPLTLNALVAACNQSSNREPVASYDEETVESALEDLKDQRLVRFVLPSHGRSVVRYRHVLDEALGLDATQSAIVAMLLLRGPQTVGELRARTERMAPVDGLDGMEHELELLAEREEPLVESVARRPGQKEGRWATTLVAPDPDAGSTDRSPHDGGAAEPPFADAAKGDDDSATGRSDTRPDARSAMPPPADPEHLMQVIDDLRADVSGLRSEVARLRSDLEELRASLGG